MVCLHSTVEHIWKGFMKTWVEPGGWGRSENNVSNFSASPLPTQLRNNIVELLRAGLTAVAET